MPSTQKAQSGHRLSELLEKEWVILTLLAVWGLVVYYSQLGSPLRGENTKYAAIARKILQHREWFLLEYDGSPYLNKPPLHFWLMAIPMGFLGPNEVAVRLPSATFGFATMFLAYYCGKVLFSRRAGLVAALVTATTHSSIFHGHEPKLDTELGFLMNLAFFAIYLAVRGGGRRFGYLCLAIVAMAMGTMLKGPVAVLLPGATALTFLLIRRRSRDFGEIILVVVGLAISTLLAVPHYWKLGGTFDRHFFLTENLMRIFQPGANPPLFYLYNVFGEFFPWSLFLPCVGVYLWKSRSWRVGEEEALLRIWAIGFFLLINVPAFKADRFLVWVIPPFALVTARYWDHLFTPNAGMVSATEERLLRLGAALLAVTIVVALFVGPSVLRKKYAIPASFWPVPFGLLLGAASVALLYMAIRQEPRGIFPGVLAVSMALTIGHVQVFNRAVATFNSPKPFIQQVRAIVGNSPMVAEIPDWTFRMEFLYYLDHPSPVLEFDDPDEMYNAFRSDGRVFGLLTRDRYERLERRGDLSVVRLGEYSYRRRDYVLVGKRPRS